MAGCIKNKQTQSINYGLTQLVVGIPVSLAQTLQITQTTPDKSWKYGQILNVHLWPPVRNPLQVYPSLYHQCLLFQTDHFHQGESETHPARDHVFLWIRVEGAQTTTGLIGQAILCPPSQTCQTGTWPTSSWPSKWPKRPYCGQRWQCVSSSVSQQHLKRELN